MYIFTFVLLVLVFFYDLFVKKNTYYKYLFISFIILFILHDGLRWGIGTDWVFYKDFFSNALDNNNDDGLELGYFFVNYIIRSFTEYYTIFLIVHATIIYSLISNTIYRFSPYPLFSIFLLYTSMLTYLGMNRQYIALAICVFSLKYVINKNFPKFLLCIFISFFFHRSSIMFLLVYLFNKEINIKYILLFLSLVIIVAFSNIINKLPLQLALLMDGNGIVGDKLKLYTEGYTLNNDLLHSIIGILKRIIILLPCLIYKKILSRHENFFLFFNMYFFGSLVYILFNNTILQIMVARGILYYNVSEIFLLPILISIIKLKELKFIFFTLIGVYGYFNMDKGMKFYKEDLGVDIFNPYNSVLINSTYNAMENNKRNE